jgi:arylsulfatase A-like enzyme
MIRRRAAGIWVGALCGLALIASGERAARGGDKASVNLLFLMTDQQQGAALGCAGNPIVKTPSLDRLAAGGTRFDNSFCVVPYCSPTRAALVTGRYPSSLGLGRNIAHETDREDPLRLRESCDTYLHHLASQGYHCHQLGKWHLGDPAELSCFPEGRQDTEAPARLANQRRRVAGEDRFDDGPRPGETERIGDVYLRSEVSDAHRRYQQEKNRPKQDVGVIGRSLLKPEYWTESVLADYCIELLKRHRDEPFAVTYSVSPPHAPFIAPSPYYDMYDPASFLLPSSWNDHPQAWAASVSARMGMIYGEAGFREYLRCYYARVTMMDSCVGRILETLDELGLADRTLVIFTSDHGTMLGRHGMMEKAVGGFYDDLMRVPLIMRLPGQIPAGETCRAYASSVDLPPTILDYLGASRLSQVHGRSLRPFVEGASEDGRPIFGERGEPETAGAARMIRTAKWKLSLLPRGEKELFNLEQDPDETRNLAVDAGMEPVIRKLSKQLLEHMQTVGDPALPRFQHP